MFFTNQQYKRVLVELPLSNDTGQPGKTSPISEAITAIFQATKRTPQLLTVIQGLLHVRESVLNNIQMIALIFISTFLFGAVSRGSTNSKSTTINYKRTGRSLLGLEEVRLKTAISFDEVSNNVLSIPPHYITGRFQTAEKRGDQISI